MKTSPVRVLYIVGCGRSGSTLLARMLGQVAGFTSIGELRHIAFTGALSGSDQELCGCGSSYASCPFWREVGHAVYGDGLAERESLQALRQAVDRIRYVPWMLGCPSPSRYTRLLQQYGEIQARLYRAVYAAGGNGLVVDASKDISTLYLLKHVPGVEVVGVVHLVRDVRGVCFSWSKKVVRPEFLDRKVYMRRLRPARTAGYWLYSNALAEMSRLVYPRYMLLRYEDLIDSPRHWIRQICELGGAHSPDLSFIDDGAVRLHSRSHMASGNPSRFERGTVVLRTDIEWRSAMSSFNRRVATALALPLLIRYGYVGRH